MFDQILSLIKIRQELPDAIGYMLTQESHLFALPVEVTDSCGKDCKEILERLSCICLSIDNYSNKVQKSIRVLLSGNSEFTPRVLFRRRSNMVTHKILSEENEVFIHEIPPNESIFIVFYNPDAKFGVEQVLVGDKKITLAMQKLAEAKRTPEIARLDFFSFLIPLITIVFISVLCYALWSRHKTEKIMNDAFSDPSLCENEIFNNSVEKEKELERRFKQLGSVGTVTLFINHVSSLDELKLKDTVILCVPLKHS